MVTEFDDDFGLSSSDELELQALADVAENGKANDRKHARVESRAENEPPSKVTKTTDTGLDVATNVLNTHFKLPAFRLKQALAISRVLNGDSAVVVFPTGGGKSLCYQVPGVAIKHLDKVNGVRQGYAEGGITLVVSPLIALMKDQVDALKRLGVRAEAMDSSKSKEEYLSTVQAMREGNLDVLYCAPERLNNEGFVASMASVKGGVRLLAVDEAHCISEWGHAFRPDYLKVARFAKEIQAERVICLTATATPKVTEDICTAFDIPPKEGVFKTPTYRDNLRLQARSFLTKEESYPELLQFLKQHPGPTIVYVTLQKHAEQLSDRLKKGDVRARYFHAGMSADDKASCQDEFMSSKNMVICATIAFGMGIDKADIRNVVHYDIPRSLEGYSQEIGRAGRDGKQSQCMLFLCAEDFHLRESFTRGDLPSRQSVRGMIQNVLSTMVSGEGKGKHIELSLFQVSKEWDIKVSGIRLNARSQEGFTNTANLDDGGQKHLRAARATIWPCARNDAEVHHIPVQRAITADGQLSRGQRCSQAVEQGQDLDIHRRGQGFPAARRHSRTSHQQTERLERTRFHPSRDQERASNLPRAQRPPFDRERPSHPRRSGVQRARAPGTARPSTYGPSHRPRRCPAVLRALLGQPLR